MEILVTGGAGYIGSHTCVALLEAGHSVVIADNLSNSHKNVVDGIQSISGKKPKYYNADVTNNEELEPIFSNHKIDGVIHFAGYKAVDESFHKPLEYYYNNLVSTLVLSQACMKYNVNKFIFSSSATVYGNNSIPFVENMQLLPPANPYGKTKAMSEQILMDIAAASPEFSVSLLRYFNPAGAHVSGLIGENPQGIPNNLMPYLVKVAKGELEYLNVYGGDYETKDGTGVRDYIHVMDVAEGHVAAIEQLRHGGEAYNLGTGRGFTVLELIEVFERVNGVEIPFRIVGRREGDIAACYADTTKAEKELGWRAERSIEDIVRDAWRFGKVF